MSQERPTYTQQLLVDLNAKQAVTEAYIQEIRDDLKEHIKRTAQNEVDIKWVKKHVFIAHGAITALGMLTGLIATLWKIGVIG